MPRCSENREARALLPAQGYRYVRLRWWALFAAIDGLGWLLVGMRRRIGRRRVGAPDLVRAVRRILIVQLDHLGDAILSTGMVGELSSRYPRAQIEVLAAPWNAEVFAASPQVSRVHICRWNRFARPGRWGWPLAIVYWGWRLRQRKFDLGVDVRGEFPLALLLRLAAVARRVGWAAGGGGFLLTDSAEYSPGISQTAARARLLDAIDRVAPGTTPAPQPHFQPSQQARQRIATRLAALPDATLIVAHLAAGTQAKRWPAAHWQELIGRLIVERGDVLIVLVGSREDRALANEVLGGREWPSASDWTGLLDIGELAALLERAGCFVGSDSGPAHLAAAVGTPSVVLFSGTNDPRAWCPPGDVVVVSHAVACAPCHRERCPLADHPCMRGIEPRQVVAAIARQFAPRRGQLEPWLEPAA
ncbi:MAG TPA: glycosyltransferase family 9 protein [Pirellulales bacterium]|jgi:lipopolysaccharide heptosyltransferase II|nr:glycosyltransferase family 9 protein [Pirellulales bacterium]